MQPFSHQQQSSSPQPSSQQTASIQPAAVPVPFTTFCGLAVLQQVTPERFCKAATGLADGSLAVVITRQTDTTIYGLAKNGKGQEYSLSLAAAGTTCSCPDFLFRHAVCKHGIALALQLLLVPQQPADPQQQPVAQAAEQPVNLRLGKVRRHWSYPA